jgi:putative hydrolase of the HAD superfamily
VTFDVTHTLIHPPQAAAIYAEVLGRHGIQATEAQLRQLIPTVWQEMACRATLGHDRFASHPGGARGFWRRFLDRLTEHLGLAPPSPFVAAELWDRFLRPEAWEVYADVRPALAELRRRGVRLGVVSNWDDRLPELLARLDLRPFFETVVYSAAVGAEKPHPRIFREAVARLSVAPEATLHVGDSRRDDLEGAQGAGLRALLLGRRGGGDVADLAALLVHPECA